MIMRKLQRWRQRVLPSSVLLLVLWIISSRLSSSNASIRRSSSSSRDFSYMIWKNWWENNDVAVDATAATTTTATASRFLTTTRGGAQQPQQPHHHHVTEEKTNKQDGAHDEHDVDDLPIVAVDDDEQQKTLLAANDSCPLESLHTATASSTTAKNRHIPENQKWLHEQEQQVNDEDDDVDSKTSTMERRRLLFLDRIALISASWMRREHDAKVTMLHDDDDVDDDDDEQQQQQRRTHDLNAITAQSDLSLPGRHFHIVTTAALPWFTGTAVNPLLRAAYLHRRTLAINNNNNSTIKQNSTTALSSESEHAAAAAAASTNSTASPPNHRFVTLVVPWLELPEDQQDLYGHVFENPAAQEAYIRNWLKEQAEMPDVACSETGLHIVFYPARYHSGLRSIFAMGDMLRMIEEESTPLDVCILEEPEHVNWFRAPGDGWTQKYNYVLGIVHTNYKEYASSHYSGLWTAPAISMVSSAMVRAYCHKVIKLSAVLQTYAPEKEVVSNVHGVRAEFLKEGIRRSQQQQQHDKLNTVQVAATTSSNGNNNNYYHNNSTNSAGIYFIGKLLWAKGLDLLLDMEDYYKQCTGSYFPIDVYGSGPEATVIMKAFHGRRGKYNNNNRTKLDEDIDQRDDNNKVKKNRRRNRAGQLLDTTLSIFGGSASPFKRKPSTQALEDDLDSSSSPSSSFPTDRLANLQYKARERLARIKQTLDSVDIPQTFAELRRQPIPATFPGRVDHAELKHHKIFVNPSVSEVLCTTTAEALAMGKFAIIPVHPSNSFFMKFPNCLAYRNKFEFVASLRWAMTHEPEPLTPELARHFTWEAATDRFISASAITLGEALQREKLGLSRLDERIAWFHNEIGKGATGDMLRRIFGAGPVSEQVRYVKEQERMGDNDGDSSASSSEDEDEDDGLSRKFRNTSFAEAIRATVGDMSSFIQ